MYNTTLSSIIQKYINKIPPYVVVPYKMKSKAKFHHMGKELYSLNFIDLKASPNCTYLIIYDISIKQEHQITYN